MGHEKPRNGNAAQGNTISFGHRLAGEYPPSVTSAGSFHGKTRQLAGLCSAFHLRVILHLPSPPTLSGETGPRWELIGAVVALMSAVYVGIGVWGSREGRT